jgi:hypothetical protein
VVSDQRLTVGGIDLPERHRAQQARNLPPAPQPQLLDRLHSVREPRALPLGALQLLEHPFLRDDRRRPVPRRRPERKHRQRLRSALRRERRLPRHSQSAHGLPDQQHLLALDRLAHLGGGHHAGHQLQVNTVVKSGTYSSTLTITLS